ncbi:hypothetical protein D3C80_1337980 [compost metagenome]
MAIRTAEIINDFRPATRPFTVEVGRFALFGDHPGNVRAFTTPAGHRQRTIFCRFWCTRSQGFTNIRDGIGMPTWLIVILGKRVSGPENDQTRVASQSVYPIGLLGSRLPGLILVRVRCREGFILGFNLLRRGGRCRLCLCREREKNRVHPCQK